MYNNLQNTVNKIGDALHAETRWTLYSKVIELNLQRDQYEVGSFMHLRLTQRIDELTTEFHKLKEQE